MTGEGLHKRVGAGVRAQMTVTTLIGVAGFVIGWVLGVQHLGWRVGLLFGWWPALMLGAGAAWVVGIGAPELRGLVSRMTARARAPKAPGV